MVQGQRFGNYELLEKIGAGGMGVVYKARQTNLERLVAVKLLPFGQFSREDLVERFRAEASAAAGLQHPNIVAIHEVGEHEGQHYFSMDFVAGRTLAELVRDQPLSAKRAAAYLKTIAEAVHYAHQHGILHRDLKPSNVIIDASDQPRVTDFGLAKRLSDSALPALHSSLTLTGQVLGSPNFMPPEQAEGRSYAIGPASDIYSLGALLYHLLTRQPPFQAETLTSLLKQVVENDPVPPHLLNPSIPRDLETICLKCLEKEPARRYSSSRALAEELGRFLEDRPIQARPVGVTGKAWKWCCRRPALASVTAALVLTFVLGFGGTLWQWRLARQSAGAELQQRLRAEAERYATDMRAAQMALADNNRPLALTLLEQHRPKSKTDTDLRGWEWRYLWQLCQADELFTLHRYPVSINGLTVSKRLNLLAVSTSGEVALWDLATTNPLTVLPKGATAALAFSPTENLLAMGTWNDKRDPVVELRDMDGTNLTRRLTLELGNRALSFSPDGKLLAIFDQQGKLTITDCASYRTITNLDVQPLRYGSAGFVVFSPDGKQLAIGEEYGALRLFDVAAGRFASLVTDTSAAISALAFSPDSELLAAGFGYGEGSIRLWETRSGELRAQWTKHTDDVTGLVFSPGGDRLISASGDGTIRIWSLADHKEHQFLQTLGERLSCLTLLPDGKTLVSGDSRGSVCFWDFSRSRGPCYTNLQITHEFGSMKEVPPAGFLPETLDPRAVRRLGVAFTPDSRYFITTDPDGTLVRWDARSFARLEALPELGSNHWGTAFSPDGHWLATGSASGQITVWDWTTRKAVTNFTAPFDWCGRLQFSSSSNYLISHVLRNTLPPKVRVWRISDWREVSLPDSQFEAIWSMDISPDDRYLVAGYNNGALKLFSWPSCAHILDFTYDEGGVWAVRFSPDGKWIAAAFGDGTTRLLDAVTRRGVSLPGHLNMVAGAAFLPDGRRLITGGSVYRDALKLWDLTAHRELLNLQAEGRYFFYVACSPDGSTIAATSLAGIAHIWRAPSWEEIAAAENK